MKKLAILMAAVLTLAGTRAAEATPIVYTASITGSGSLGGTPFTNALVTVALSGDTTGAFLGGPGVWLNNGTGTVTVAGLGTATLTNTIRAVSNQNVLRAGISDFSLNFAILFIDNAGFATYDLTTPIGPLVGAGAFNPAINFPTTGGLFNLSSVGTPPGSFTATVTAVPEPSALALLGVGLAGLGLRLRRRETQR